MRASRMTTRRWMIVVAVAGLVLGVVVLVVVLTPRFLKLQVEFQDRVPTR